MENVSEVAFSIVPDFTQCTSTYCWDLIPDDFYGLLFGFIWNGEF